MVETQAVLDAKPKNLICNFRAPNLAEFQRWKVYVQWAKDNGMDVCHLTLSLTDFFMKCIEVVAEVRNGKQVVNIQQNNVLQYKVSKPRREPYDLGCVKREYRKTFSSVLFEAYVLNKALAKERIVVEHTNSRVKKFQIWGGEFRNRLKHYYVAAEIVSGIVNFRISGTLTV